MEIFVRVQRVFRKLQKWRKSTLKVISITECHKIHFHCSSFKPILHKVHYHKRLSPVHKLYSSTQNCIPIHKLYSSTQTIFQFYNIPLNKYEYKTIQDNTILLYVMLHDFEIWQKIFRAKLISFVF